MDILKWLGAAAAFVAGLKALYELYKWLKPLTELSEKFSQLEDIATRFDTLERHTKENYEALQEHIAQDKETNKIVCRAMMLMMRHMRTDNSLEQIKECEDDMVAFLADK